jgi:aspartate dehydrogenase
MSTKVTIVGFGAIGRALVARASKLPAILVTHVVVRNARVSQAQAALVGLNSSALAVDAVPLDASLLLECAGHGALSAHVIPALQRGVECAVLSVGALSEPGLPEKLEEAARQGATRLTLLPGAIGGNDAISAARLGGLDDVIYTGRKPPAGWKGTPADALLDLDGLDAPAVFFEGSARDAARLYPKNANVAATLSLAGTGLDRTQVRLIADPGVADNIHEVEARGAFGEMKLTMRGRPLPENPKTSSLTVLSALRFLYNRAMPIAL